MAHTIVTGLTISTAARTILELDPAERDAAIVRLRAIVAHRAFDTGAIATVSRELLAQIDQALGVQPLSSARDILRSMGVTG